MHGSKCAVIGWRRLAAALPDGRLRRVTLTVDGDRDIGLDEFLPAGG
jgi:hypothetical protein